MVMHHKIETFDRRRRHEMSGELMELGFCHRERVIALRVARAQSREADLVRNGQDMKLMGRVGAFHDATHPVALFDGV